MQSTVAKAKSTFRQLRQRIFNTPIIGYLAKIMDHIVRAPSYYSNLYQRIEELERHGRLFADNHALDVFYTGFEDRFRGGEQSVRERLEVYLPLFKKQSGVKFFQTPVLDIGSGRGEFLELLKEHGIKARGIDINTDMVSRAQAKSLDVISGEAGDFLNSQKPGSFGAITGFHIVEHIPFESLIELLTTCQRALVNNGFVLFETPNPENLSVGAYSFYLDPSHLNPIPPALLQFACESVGFNNVEIKRLHPALEGNNTGLPNDVYEKLYGPQDYAVIAYK